MQFQLDHVINQIVIQLGFYSGNLSNADKTQIKTQIDGAITQINPSMSLDEQTIQSANSQYETNAEVFVIIYCVVPMLIIGLLVIFGKIKINWIEILIILITNIILIISFELCFLYFVFNVNTPIEIIY
jgi:hypothetical protein